MKSCWKCEEIRIDTIGGFYCNQGQDMNADECEKYEPEPGTDESVREELCQ